MGSIVYEFLDEEKISVGRQVAQIHNSEVIGYPQVRDPLST